MQLQTLKELLVWSKYLLCKFEDEWTLNQDQRATVLFEKYPLLKQAYKFTESFRKINTLPHREGAVIKFNQSKLNRMVEDEYQSLKMN